MKLSDIKRGDIVTIYSTFLEGYETYARLCIWSKDRKKRIVNTPKWLRDLLMSAEQNGMRTAISALEEKADGLYRGNREL